MTLTSRVACRQPVPQQAVGQAAQPGHHQVKQPGIVLGDALQGSAVQGRDSAFDTWTGLTRWPLVRLHGSRRAGAGQAARNCALTAFNAGPLVGVAHPQSVWLRMARQAGIAQSGQAERKLSDHAG
jgi:hypothetical protein